eukprot:SAG11_NODE_1384_length_5070_cov_110.918527_4_plen_262_part_01
MWYALYGETLTRSEVFEEKMLGLCRELGERGKLSRGAGVKEAGGGASADADGASLGRDSVLAVLKGGEHGGAEAVTKHLNGNENQLSLRSELDGLRVRDLRARAIDSGISSDEVDEALVSEDAKPALIALLLASHVEVQGAQELEALLRTSDKESGRRAAVAIAEHAIEVLEACLNSTPRRGRKSLRELLGRTEALAECLESDRQWCESVSRASVKQLASLAASLAAVMELSASQPGAAEAVAASVSELIACAEECSVTSD